MLLFVMLSEIARDSIVLTLHAVAAAEGVDAVVMTVACLQVCVGLGSAGQFSTEDKAMAFTSRPLEEGSSLFNEGMASRTMGRTRGATS